MKLIAFYGGAKVGKTTWAHKLQKEIHLKHPTICVIDSLAKPIKEDNPLPEGISKEEYRKVYITYGDYLKAKYGDDYFARILLDRNKNTDILIIDDLRFKSEDLLFKKRLKTDYIPIYLTADFNIRMGRFGDKAEFYINNTYFTPSEQEHIKFTPTLSFKSDKYSDINMGIDYILKEIGL